MPKSQGSYGSIHCRKRRAEDGLVAIGSTQGASENRRLFEAANLEGRQDDQRTSAGGENQEAITASSSGVETFPHTGMKRRGYDH